MEQKELLARVDHTLLRQDASWEEIRALCDDGMRYGCASVCIPASYVKDAAAYLDGKLPVCTVIGFPHGAHLTEVKVFEAKKAMEDGCRELDMVLAIGKLKAGEYD